jgi:hypothetical protein
MALRLRRSRFMEEYFSGQQGEEDEIASLAGEVGKKRPRKKEAIK